jgi:hypothetical protein
MNVLEPYGGTALPVCLVWSFYKAHSQDGRAPFRCLALT